MSQLFGYRVVKLWQREAVAYLLPPGATDAVKVSGLRMTFKVEKSLRKSPNKLELSIYNLSKATLSQVQARHTQVELAAGYHDALGQIFKGEARSILPVREGPDWVCKVNCGDGGVAYGYGRGAQSFAPGTKASDVLVGLAKSAKVGVGNAVAAFQKGGVKEGFDTFVHGFTSCGDAQSDIDNVVRTAGFSWSIQDGELQLLRDERDTLGQAEVLSPDTGLVGSPEMGSSERKHGPAFLKVKALLRPQLKPGSVVQVESQGIKGQFRAEKVCHEGDTWGGDFFTTLEARAL